MRIVLIITAALLVGGSAGFLPSWIQKIHLQRLQLLKESQASKWPKALQLKE